MIVMVYGYEGTNPGHWQTLLTQELTAKGTPCVIADLPEPLAPDKDVWVACLDDYIRKAEGEPVTFVCHSLGCWAVDHLLAERGAEQIHAVLLVAPPSPYLLFEAVQSFLPPPLKREAWAPIAARSLLLGADNDDYASSEEHAEIARDLGIAHRVVPGGHHLNTDAGYGDWDLPRQWLAEVGATP